MKIQLDTNLKTIKVEENVNLKEFMDFIKIILPDGMWKDYTLETNVIINWTSNPIVINPYRPYYPEPYWPWLNPQWGGVTGGIIYTQGATGTGRAAANDDNCVVTNIKQCGIYNISTE